MDPGTIALIAAGIGALGGFLGSSSARKQAKRSRHFIRQQSRRARAFLQPEFISKLSKELLPLFRSGVLATGVGPALQQGAKKALAPFRDTGLGAVLGAGVEAMPESIAAGQSLSLAPQLASGLANATLAGQIPSFADKGMNPLLAGLQTGIQSYLTASLLGERPEGGSTLTPDQQRNINIAGGWPMQGTWPGVPGANLPDINQRASVFGTPNIIPVLNPVAYARF